MHPDPLFQQAYAFTLAPSWQGLLKRVSDRYERTRLSRFFTFASANGIEPEQVNDQTVANLPKVSGDKQKWTGGDRQKGTTSA